MSDVLLGAVIGAVALTVPTYLGLTLRTHLKWRRIVRDRRAAAAIRAAEPHDAEMAAARDADRVARVAEGGGL